MVSILPSELILNYLFLQALSFLDTRPVYFPTGQPSADISSVYTSIDPYAGYDYNIGNDYRDYGYISTSQVKQDRYAKKNWSSQ